MVGNKIIRQWELSSNSSHYDRMVAAPSDNVLVVMWITWSIVSFLVLLFILFVFFPILFSKDTKNNPFNVYLLFIMIPDMILSFCCGISCLVNAINGEYTSDWACKVQSFYLIFGIGASSWMNTIVVYQVFKMLNSAKKCKRYQPPTISKAIRHSTMVFAYCAFLSSLGLWDVSWLPHKTRLLFGAGCAPLDYDTTSTIFFYCVFFPLKMGFPCAYLLYCGYRIYRHNILPPKGRRRLLWNFFIRLAAAFYIMWLPGFFLLFVASSFTSPWIQWAGAMWGHLQGVVSAGLTFLRPDINDVVLDFWCCCHFHASEKRPSLGIHPITTPSNTAAPTEGKTATTSTGIINDTNDDRGSQNNNNHSYSEGYPLPSSPQEEGNNSDDSYDNISIVSQEENEQC